LSEAFDLQQLGWTDDRAGHWHETYGGSAEGVDRGGGDGLRPGRVASQQRGILRLLTEHGAFDADVSGRLRYLALDETELPAVGDWVAAALRPHERTATIHRVLPRTSALIRSAPADRGQDAQVLASNLDTVWVVTSMNRDFNPRRIERTLALVREGGAEGVVVLSKGDLAEDRAAFVTRTEEVAPGTAVHCVSALDRAGLEALRGYLAPGRSVALIGSSGVGKSTLINALLGRDVLATSDIRDDDDKGRHTTTHRELLPLPGAGVLIDTPGLREVALWADDEGGIESAFPDLETLFARCRFHDCGHGNEPGCAIREALEDGSLDPSRLESYRKLKREALRIALKRNAKGRHEQRKTRKKFAKLQKQRPNKRNPRPPRS
jgi:ribosome biogenesis GTPase